MNWKVALIVVTLLTTCGFGWLKEHDKRIAAQAKIDEQAVELKQSDKQIAGFITSLEQWNSVYSKATTKYIADKNKLNTLLDDKYIEINKLNDQLIAVVPDSSKQLVTKLVGSCKISISGLKTILSTCDSLRRAAIAESDKKDVVIIGVSASRDRWHNLFDKEHDLKHTSGTWGTVGKVETAVGIVATVTKFLKFW